MMCERAISRTTQGELLSKKQMVQEMIADSWLEMEMFRLFVLRTAWRIDKYQDYKKVRKDISGVKAAMPGVYRNIATRARDSPGAGCGARSREAAQPPDGRCKTSEPVLPQTNASAQPRAGRCETAGEHHRLALPDGRECTLR